MIRLASLAALIVAASAAAQGPMPVTPSPTGSGGRPAPSGHVQGWISGWTDANGLDHRVVTTCRGQTAADCRRRHMEAVELMTRAFPPRWGPLPPRWF